MGIVSCRGTTFPHGPLEQTPCRLHPERTVESLSNEMWPVLGLGRLRWKIASHQKLKWGSNVAVM